MCQMLYTTSMCQMLYTMRQRATSGAKNQHWSKQLVQRWLDKKHKKHADVVTYKADVQDSRKRRFRSNVPTPLLEPMQIVPATAPRAIGAATDHSPRDRRVHSARRTHDRHAREPTPTYPSAALRPVTNEPHDRRPSRRSYLACGQILWLALRAHTL